MLTRNGILSWAALALNLIGILSSPRVYAQNLADAMPGAQIPTVLTANLGRQGAFYVGGHYVGEPGKEIMDGAMYVEVMVPKKIRHPYPVIFLCGGAGRTGYDLLQTPDGRPGWAYNFLDQGYTVYLVDFPARGRSAYVPGVDGKLGVRTAPQIEEVWTDSNELGQWPQAKKYTEWPGKGPSRGKIGDPVFDNFAKAGLDYVPGTSEDKATENAILQLVDLIGKPVILLIHSQTGATGWLVADARPKLIKGIIAVEPVAPPIQNAQTNSRPVSGDQQPTAGRLWGITELPINYDPPVHDPSELKPIRQEKADGPGLIPCWVQEEPAHKLINLKGIPVLNVSGEASYHRPYAHCVAKWLNQAGVKTTFVRLEDVGLTGNNHEMLIEKNSADIAKYFQSWLDKNVR